MQTTALKSSDVAQNAHVVRIWRSPKRNPSQRQRVVPSAAVHKPPNKWTVVAAFILAVALHAGAVVWAEMQQAKPTLEADATAPACSATARINAATTVHLLGGL